jgi:hypothetical protein
LQQQQQQQQETIEGLDEMGTFEIKHWLVRQHISELHAWIASTKLACFAVDKYLASPLV